MGGAGESLEEGRVAIAIGIGFGSERGSGTGSRNGIGGESGSDRGSGVWGARWVEIGVEGEGGIRSYIVRVTGSVSGIWVRLFQWSRSWARMGNWWVSG